MAQATKGRLVVYTALFGPHAKQLAEPRWCHPVVPMRCFTDRTDLRSRHWQITRMPRESDPARANRRLKLLSHRTVSAEWSLYLDSNIRLLTDPRTLLDRGDFVTHRHHHCANIAEELQEILSYRPGTDPALVKSQVAEYQRQGFGTAENPQPHHSANGVLLRRHTLEVCALNEAWWDEVQRHSARDQLSLDYCAWRANFTLSDWPGSVIASPYFYAEPARRQ